MKFFNKKVKPDYTPRVEHTTTNKKVLPPVVFETVAPVAPPPPPPAPMKFTPPIVYHEDKKIFPNVITYSSVPILPLTLNQYSVSAPAPDSVIGSGFSPNLETFPTLNNSYFSGGANSGTGSTGPTGCTGPVGQSGKDSETGATGPMGSTGWTGYTGSTGPKGDPGPSGGELWSTYPATTSVNFASNDLLNVSTINGTAYTPTSNWSNLPATTTVNMSNNSLNNVSGVNLTTPPDTAVLLTAGAGNVLNVNGVPVGGGGTPETWANYSAINDVNIPDHDLNITTTTPGVGYNKASINANVTIGNTTQAPLRPDLNAYCGSVNFGGLANPLTNMNIYSLGAVNIDSLTGIAVAGGGGVSISGAGGVNVTGAGALVLNGGNVEIGGAGGVIVNGTGAITITAGGVFVQGGGVAISAGGCAITAGGLSIAGGAVTMGAAGAAGGDLTIYGGDLNMATVGASPSAIKTNRLESVGTNTLAISGVSTINGLPYPPVGSVVYQGTYFKSTAQTLTSGNTDVIFDLTGSWNNTGGYITHTDGTTAFTVVQTGIYQLEFNATVLANGATYTTTSGKSVAIDITRSPTAEQSVVINSALQATALNYVMSVGVSYYLIAGDVINLRVGNTFTGGPPTLLQLQNTFDLNTFFTWTYVSSGGALAYQNPPPVIQAAGTTALIPSTANTLYIITSGTTQNFTTASLSAGNAGAVWYVKNSQPQGGGGNDVTIQANGTSITGATSTIHQTTNTTNTAIQTLYWNGTTLIMY